MKEILLTFLPFLISAFLIPIIILISKKLNVMDHPGERKVHTASKPHLGGIAIYAGFIIGFFLFYKFGYVFLFRKFQVFLLGLSIMFFIGLLDDIFNLKPWIKLFAQVGVGILFISLGEISTVFLPVRIFAYIITFLWIIGITNSFNLLDNMDGLSSGISIICGSMFAILYFQLKQFDLMTICIIFTAAQLGFIIYNFYPSKIFMGDTGSLFSGYFFATISIMGSYTEFSRLSRLPVLIPILLLAVPIFDTLSVIIIRLRKKLPLFKGDKNHFSHRLVELGLTQKQAVLFIYLVTFGTGISSIFLPSINLLQALFLFLQVFLFIGIIVILMVTAKKFKEKNGDNNE